MVEQVRDSVGQELRGTGFEEGGRARLDAEVKAKRHGDAEWYNEDANFKAAVDFVLDAKALALGPARLEWIAGLASAEAERHAAFALECARSEDVRAVRAVPAALRAFAALPAAVRVPFDRMALEALHAATGGGGE
eukprot:2016906-Prymnesium_polylepis.1